MEPAQGISAEARTRDRARCGQKDRSVVVGYGIPGASWELHREQRERDVHLLVAQGCEKGIFVKEQLCEDGEKGI